MIKQYQLNHTINYVSTIWLLAAQVLVMLPFMLHLPLWLLPVLLLSGGWRLSIVQGKLQQPSTHYKLLVMLIGIAGLFISGLRPPALDAMVALLLLGFAFKALEMQKQRDAIVVIFLGYLLIGIHFLYSQSLLASAYGIVCLILLTATLISTQQQYRHTQRPRQAIKKHLRLAGILVLQCLPLMLLSFVFAPRFPPLWQLPNMNNNFKTGISERMTPGDIANLSKSGELAFRVKFNQPTQRPQQNQLYWRGLVLNHFDGKTWQQFRRSMTGRDLQEYLQFDYSWHATDTHLQGDSLAYETIFERSGQPWLFSLATATQADGQIMRTADYNIVSRQNIMNPTLIRFESHLKAQRDKRLHPRMKRLALQLPAQGDSRSRQFAQALLAQHPESQAYIQAVLQHYRQQPFYYTLNPPLLGDHDTIDGFLFDSRQGFCSHYAGSFVYLMRLAGIPARVVVGYQGGQWHEAGQYLAVYQSDAHAWTEVWLPEQGWQRIDPTAMVAPSRVEQGLDAALPEEMNSLFPLRQIQWLNNMQLYIDQLQYGWQRWILGYDTQTQNDFLQRLFGKLEPGKIALVILISFALLGLFWFMILGLYKRRSQEALEHQLYRRFERQLAKLGQVRLPHQTPQQFAAQAMQALPDYADNIEKFTITYQQLCYDEPLVRDNELATLRQQLKHIH